MNVQQTHATGPMLSADDAAAHAEAIVKRSGTSFYWGMRRMAEEKRRAMYAVYAFCREVDDIADDSGEPEEKLFRLGQWRGEIERLYGDNPALPTARALADPVERFDLRKQDFRAIIDGMAMDAADQVRMADMDELGLYCDRVACAVGRHSIRIFGVPVEQGDALAHALGNALQLTNILRDIREDAERDRLYLPADVLKAHDMDGSDMPAVIAHPALPRVCELLADVAERRFIEARAIMADCEPGQIRPAIMMMEVYHRILGKLTAQGWVSHAVRVRLSRLEKLWVVFRYGIV